MSSYRSDVLVSIKYKFYQQSNQYHVFGIAVLSNEKYPNLLVKNDHNTQPKEAAITALTHFKGHM